MSNLGNDFGFWNNTIDNLDSEADREPDLRSIAFALDLLAQTTGGCVIVVNNGGVRVDWEHGDKSIALVVNPTYETKYLYRECPGHHITTNELTPDTLKDWLAWLNSDEKQPIPQWLDMVLRASKHG